MKKLLLGVSTLLLSLGMASAQTPGVTSTSAYDDFQSTTQYSNADGSGIYWYSGNSSNVNGARTVNGSTFSYATAGVSYIAADFGHINSGATQNVLDLTSMADIEVNLKNSSATKDLVMRVYLKDTNNIRLEIEPNVSDCAGVPDFATPTPGISWSNANMVYPQPTSYPTDPAVYPTEAYNGFVIPANATKTYRIDLSSVAGAIGGLWTDGSWGNPAKPSNAPNTVTPSNAGFDITAVHVVEFVFNENTAFNLTDNAINKGSYKYDAKGPAQSDYTGDIVFYSFKVGSVLSALPADPDITAVKDAVIDNSLSIYPNPASEALTVSFKAASGASVVLTDIVGNKVYSTNANAGDNKITVNTSGLTTGVYILNITTESGKVARKVNIK